MSSIADDLRDRTRAQVLALSAPERIQLALSLGDADADQYARARGLDRAEAIRRLRQRRTRGRRASVAGGR